jgi:hypothetical protein
MKSAPSTSPSTSASPCDFAALAASPKFALHAARSVPSTAPSSLKSAARKFAVTVKFTGKVATGFAAPWLAVDTVITPLRIPAVEVFSITCCTTPPPSAGSTPVAPPMRLPLTEST